MPTTIQIPVSRGGTNVPYNDGTGAYGMKGPDGYGWVTYYFPMLSEYMAMMASYLTDVQGQNTLAQNWATKIDGTVDGTSFSSKEYGQGSQAGTGGSSKNWAQQIGAVTGAGANDRSSKSWAQADLTGATLGGSAKDWAQSAGLPDGVSKSAKSYATDSSTSAAASATSATASEASRDAIDNRIYPGVYAVNPTTRPDGSAIQTGDMAVFTGNVIKTYASGVWAQQTAADSAALANSTDPTKGAALVGYDGGTVKGALELSPSRFGRVSAASLPRFFDKLRAYRHDLQAPLKIVGFGSSVGVGATLPDPATQAPVKFFGATLKSKLDPGGLYNIVTTNQSVNGSTVTDFPTAWAASLAAGDTPDIAFFAYGMNDGAVAQYNSGQTFPGFYTALRSAVLTARAAGCDVVICTTPHPSVVNYAAALHAMPAGIPQNYPTAVAANVQPEQLQPPASQSNVTADFLFSGVTITLSHRYLRINQAKRDLAAEFGCMLLDVERYWMEAIQKYKLSTGSMAGAENTLYNANESVHPNLLGHQLSYQKASTEACLALAGQAMQASHEPRLNGLQSVNLPIHLYTPTAALDVYAPYGDVTRKPFSAKAQIGAPDGNGIGAQTEVAYVDPANGDWVTPGAILGGNSTSSQVGRRPALSLRNYLDERANTDIHAQYNVAAAGTASYTMPDNTGGVLRIRAIQGGVALSQLYENRWTSHNGVLTLGTTAAEGLLQIGAGTEFTVSVVGLVVTATAVYNNTNLYFLCEEW